MLDNMETDKLIELPADFFKIIDETGITKKQKKKDKQKHKDHENAKATKDSSEKQLKSNEVAAVQEELPRPKKRIFLVSATLTREFKGGKYYTKKERQEDQLLKKDAKNRKGQPTNELASE